MGAKRIGKIYAENTHTKNSLKSMQFKNQSTTYHETNSRDLQKNNIFVQFYLVIYLILSGNNFSELTKNQRLWQWISMRTSSFSSPFAMLFNVYLSMPMGFAFTWQYIYWRMDNWIFTVITSAKNNHFGIGLFCHMLSESEMISFFRTCLNRLNF